MSNLTPITEVQGAEVVCANLIRKEGFEAYPVGPGQIEVLHGWSGEPVIIEPHTTEAKWLTEGTEGTDTRAMRPDFVRWFLNGWKGQRQTATH